MACFLFHPRVASLTALPSIRSRIGPDLISKYRLARTIVTKTKGNSKPLFARWPPPLTSVPNVRWVSSKASGRSRTLKALRVLCLAGGFVFWSSFGVCFVLCATGLLELGYEKRTIQSQQDQSLKSHVALATLFQLHQDSDDSSEAKQLMENKADEYRLKRAAYMSAWAKLKNDEGFRRKFGEKVLAMGYNRQEILLINARDNLEGSEEDSFRKDEDRWKVCLFVVGSKLSGLVTIEFHKVTKGEIKWIPVSLLVEEIPRYGIKICDISAPLPNGISKFTRLMNDD